MANQANTKISINNFGPVKDGEFELRPLTLFIGPNNSGKSYMALLVYALTQALSVRHRDEDLFELLGNTSNMGTAQITELSAWLRKVIKEGKNGNLKLPTHLQENLRKNIESYVYSLTQQVEVSLQDYFIYDSVEELRKVGGRPSTLSVTVGSADATLQLLTIKLGPKSKNCSVIIRQPKSKSGYSISVDNPTGSLAAADLIAELAAEGMPRVIWRTFLQEIGFPSQNSYYLPSARSGILQGWSIFISAVLQAVRRRGLRYDMPSLQGVIGDFLGLLVTRLLPSQGRLWDARVSEDSEARRRLKPALQLLEDRVFQGKISLSENRLEQPSLLYKSDLVQVPLPRASSMIAELAPLDLWLKNILEPGDLLIIDEPEAHQHPENQRMIARVLVRLMRAGITVICPTHSSLILHQISNNILISQLPEEVRRKEFPDFTDDDLITNEEVGVYLFDLQEDGTHIKTVPINSEFGISEDEFVRVAEAIGDQTYHVTMASQNGDKGLE